MNQNFDVNVHLRWMIRKDLVEVAYIDACNFDEPWGEPEYLESLRNRSNIGLVAELEEAVVAVMVYQIGKHHYHIERLAVDHGFHREGIGAQLIAKMIGKLRPDGRRKITVEVPETNFAAQNFFKHMGFEAIAIYRNFYDHCDDDAYVMQYNIEKAAKETIFTNRFGASK